MEVADADVDWLAARSADGGTLFVVLLNGSPRPTTTTATLDPRALVPGERAEWGRTDVLAGNASRTGDEVSVSLPGNGMAVLALGVASGTDPAGPARRTFAVTGDPARPDVSWSYRTVTTSWAQWRAPGGTWQDTPAATGYAFRQVLDLSTVDGPVEVRTATRAADGTVGCGPAVRH